MSCTGKQQKHSILHIAGTIIDDLEPMGLLELHENEEEDNTEQGTSNVLISFAKISSNYDIYI